ncbi:MAG TPA: mechanosensitive ion channel family protein [Devosiaceae bacterium]|jgi:small-conductance mechanosensitive channel|nr:mechanosensitive ion channel family protein [Devosiaceae bacterium]
MKLLAVARRTGDGSNEKNSSGWWRVLLIALLMIVVVAPVPAQDLLSVGEEAGAPRQPIPAVPEEDDATIADRLQRIMESTGWFTSPSATVSQGVVVLNGWADTIEHRRWAGTLAENTEGTVAVVNRMEVDADIGATFGRAGAEIVRLSRQALQTLPLVVLAISIIAAAWLVAKLVAMAARRFFARRIPSPLLLSVVARAFSIPVFLLGIYFVLQVAGLTRLALTVLGGTGLLGIVLGFAFRDIAENFLASLLLSARNPFRGGDLIEVAGHTGIVQNLNTRSTVLLTLDGNHVQIPNATVYKSTIKNYSTSRSRRADFTVGIAYDASAAKAQTLIAGVLQQHPAVLDDPEPLVLVEQLGAATVDLRAFYWFDSATYSPDKTNSALLRQTKNVLTSAGIEMPDTAREVVFPKGVPLVQLPEHAEPQPVKGSGPASSDEASDATTGEGGLRNETSGIREQANTTVPEAGQNLLKE